MMHEELDTTARRQEIVRLLMQNGKVRVNDLAKRFSISEVTIRNDLTILEHEGFLERIHGGAVSTRRAYYNMSISERALANEAEKRRIAARTAALVSDGETLLINSGTTTLYVAQALKERNNLTVLTNSLPIAQEMGYHAATRVILLGGNLDSRYQYTYGDHTLYLINQYRADKLILSVDGVSAEDGASTYHHLERSVDMAMLERAGEAIIAADYNKIGRVSFATVCPVSRIHTLVTNKGANADELAAIADCGVEILEA
jgi:DeoR/GlpR family transcriptional regulator of sugar metabolism